MRNEIKNVNVQIVVTKKNFYEVIENREVRDVLIQEKHPVRGMCKSGYTYLDYVLYKTKKTGRPLVKIINEMNDLFSKGKHIEYFN